MISNPEYTEDQLIILKAVFNRAEYLERKNVPVTAERLRWYFDLERSKP